ncbi:MAG: beta-N-acetylhexosaminidase [Carboxylicivirga sp.]|jgi:hexosaminidase|nr:beta-N-acetylhexosaminidase [Carboxylicivirga sp.]
MKKIIYISCLLLLLMAGNAFANINIIPKPHYLKAGTGQFRFNGATLVAASKELSDEARLLADMFTTVAGYSLEITKKEKSADVIFRYNPTLKDELGDEGYKLNVTSDKIVIEAAGKAGAFYAVQSIKQMLPVEVAGYYPVPDVKMSIPCVEIKDYPRFKWRGYMLDCSRFFPSVDRIKKHLDIMALYKLNTFQWHLIDYQGWRMQVMKYPNLTKIGSQRDQTIIRQRGKVDYEDKTPDNGFYTQEQIKEIVAYAAERHITIIPEIDVPAHSIAAIAAYPELSCTGEPAKVRELKVGGMSNVFCPGKDFTFKFIEDVLTEVFELFPSQVVHIGGDEVKKEGWQKCEHCSKRMKEEHLEDYDELQSYFIKRVEKFANKKGKTIIGWDEILDGGLAPNAMVMSWRGEKGGIKAAKMKHQVVMTPHHDLYLDYVQSKERENEPYVAFANVLPLERVYNYDPVPEQLTDEEKQYIVGAQANMWSNFINTPAHFEYMTYPRLCALAELTWTNQEDKDYSEFQNKLEKQYQRFHEMHVAYRRHDK